MRSWAAGLRIAIAAAAALTAVGVLSGCSSFFSSSSSGTHLAYVVGGQTDVAAYRIGNNSGTATSIFTAPFVAGTSPSSVVVHPSNRFLYVANEIDNTISLFNIDSTTGALTEVLPRTTAGISPAFMSMDGAGSFLFVANQFSNNVLAFQIGTGGALTLVSNTSVGSSPSGMVLSSSGTLYVPVPNFSAIYVFSVSSGSLTPVPNQPFFVTNGVGGIAVDPGAKFLYATNPTTNTVSAFAIQPDGSLSAMPGLTVATGTTPVAAAINAAGSALYVANSGSANVSQFKIDATTGVLTTFTAGLTVIAGTNPAFVVVDPGGKFIFVGNTGSKSLTEFSINATGSLNNLSTVSLSFVPRSFGVTQ